MVSLSKRANSGKFDSLSGDRYRIGNRLFEVTQPRITSYRFDIRVACASRKRILRPFCRLTGGVLSGVPRRVTDYFASPEGESTGFPTVTGCPKFGVPSAFQLKRWARGERCSPQP